MSVNSNANLQTISLPLNPDASYLLISQNNTNMNL